LKQRLGVLNSSLRLVMRGRLAGPSGVLELVASSPHRPKGPEPVAELGTHGHLDDIVPARSRWAQALVGKDRGAGVPGGVICKDVGAVGILIGYLAGCFEGARRLLE